MASLSVVMPSLDEVLPASLEWSVFEVVEAIGLAEEVWVAVVVLVPV